MASTNSKYLSLFAVLVTTASVAIALSAFRVGPALAAGQAAHPPFTPPRGFVWDDRVFFSKASLARWLRSRGSRYAAWARRHPAAKAVLEGLPPPPPHTTARQASEARRRRTASNQRQAADFSGLWLLVCLVMGAFVISTERRRQAAQLTSRVSPERIRRVRDWNR
jgi:hypothetical protein